MHLSVQTWNFSVQKILAVHHLVSAGNQNVMQFNLIGSFVGQ